MTQFRALFGLSLKAVLTSSRGYAKNRKKAVSGGSFLLLICALMAYMGFTYAQMYAQILRPYGRLDLMPAMMAMIAAVVCFVMSTSGSSGFIFGGRDTDLLLAMPVSDFLVLLSKVMALYVENAASVLCLMAPATVLWIREKGAGAAIPVLIIGSLLLPLLPMAIGLFFGFLFGAIQSRGSHRALVGNLVYFVFFGLILAVSVGTSVMMQKGGGEVVGLLERSVGWCLPAVWYAGAFTVPSAADFVRFTTISVVPFLAVVWFISLFFRRILTSLQSVSVRHDYRMRSLKTGGPMKAMYVKELRRLTGTPIYLMNTGIGCIMLLVGSIYMFYEKLSGQLSASMTAGTMFPFCGLVLGFCLLMSSSTAASVSLERDCLWILCEAPVTTGSIFAAKILTNLTMTLPSVLISVPFAAAAFGFSPLQMLELTLFGLVCSLLTAFAGLLCNLHWPKLDAINDTVAIKQSASVAVTIFAGFGLLAAAFGLWMLLAGRIGSEGAIGLITALFAAVTAAVWVLLEKKGPAMFAELIG